MELLTKEKMMKYSKLIAAIVPQILAVSFSFVNPELVESIGLWVVALGTPLLVFFAPKNAE